MTTHEVITDHRNQAWSFLDAGRQYLAQGDLHQASEKGWGAAAHMAKALAEAQGWEYDKHRDFSLVMHQASRLTSNDRLLDLRARAELLHGNYYKRKIFLDADIIGKDLDSIAELLAILSPLTEPA